MDNKLEEARRHHSKYKCKGMRMYYSPATVSRCPHGYWGRRCELHFVARLFAPVKGHIEVEKSSVSAFAFIILMLIVTIGLICYTYRNCPHGYWGRRCELHFVARLFAPVKGHIEVEKSSEAPSPTGSTRACMARCNTTQYFDCRTPFSPLSRSYGQLSGGNGQYSISSLAPSLSTAFGRLSLSSCRLQRYSDVHNFKFSPKATSSPTHSINETSSCSNRMLDQTIYRTAMNSMVTNQSLRIVDKRVDQPSSVIVEAPVTVHHSPE
ncbi:hypothetical protein DICVIV_04982 [Dictyocaulus viviparus]|uniref:Uncharacterized protein n=1 Tax=Dictyocaulus viviparus TaxID=29172 RepID=A0A0D8XYI4_DICVI|nr:hypothetical protein DICVIV_04982 [Dictyocaulus viviparus]